MNRETVSVVFRTIFFIDEVLFAKMLLEIHCEVLIGSSYELATLFYNWKVGALCFDMIGFTIFGNQPSKLVKKYKSQKWCC